MSKQYRIEIGMGTQLDRSGVNIEAWIDNAFKQIEERAVELFGGFTWIGTIGGWENPEGEVVCERGRTLLIYAKDEIPPARFKAEALAQFVAQKLNQEAVALSVGEVEFAFIGQETPA